MTENEQIQEMARYICEYFYGGRCYLDKKDCDCKCSEIKDAQYLYAKGYRKVERGEWKRIEINGKHYGQVYYQHSDCPINQTQMFPSPYNACPNCGADMRKEDEAK